MGNKCLIGAFVAGLGFGTVTPGRAQSVAANMRPETTVLARVDVDVDNMPLTSVLESIARQANLRLALSDRLTGLSARVSLHVRQMRADDALAKVLTGTGITAAITSGYVTFSQAREAGKVDGMVTGHVVDGKTKAPLRGVLVTIDAAKKGVTTDAEGAFRLSGIAAGSHVIHVRLIGYGRTSLRASVPDGETSIGTITMMPSVTALDQVVVTGTVIPTELKAVPSAITVITAKEIEQRGVTRIDQLFRGDVPGVWVQDLGEGQATDPGKSLVASRGNTTLDGGTPRGMKVYVDGVELANATYLGLIDARAIERVEILTGPQASTIYGSNAYNGVIQVFTKRGETIRPQVTLSSQSAWTQNNFSSTLAPNHDETASLSGVEGHLSYSGNLTWQYMGSWSPAVHETMLDGFGGLRMERGPVTLDVSVRQSQGNDIQHGSGREIASVRQATGLWNVTPGDIPDGRRTTNADHEQQIRIDVTPWHWWSHTLTVGSDVLNNRGIRDTPSYLFPGDSTFGFYVTNTSKMTMAYNSTLQVPLTAVARGVLTVGMDGSRIVSQSSDASFSSSAQIRNGRAPNWSGSESSDNSHGAFMQGQVGILETLFFTYGIRADWNPLYGDDANPNLAPRYGLAYSTTLGNVTAKLRASYGRSTRPPAFGKNEGLTAAQQCNFTCPWWGDAYRRLPNPDLLPEHKQGGEGGLELYYGTRTSLIVTRFNETMDNLIVEPFVDSTYGNGLIFTLFPSFCGTPANPNPRCQLKESENLNLGSIRNQGWELKGTVTTGSITTKGTYSWTKSRLIGITRRYAKQFPQYVVGAPFDLVPEHTWALDVTYSRGGTTASVNLQGQGAAYLSNYFGTNDGSAFSDGRLRMQDGARILDVGLAKGIVSRYAKGDVNVSHQMTAHVESLLQIQNVLNSYRTEETGFFNATAGRTTRAGLRVRL